MMVMLSGDSTELIYPLACCIYVLTDDLYSSNCPKILYTKFSDTMPYANSIDPNQPASEEQSNQDLHCLPFHQTFFE